MIRLNNAAMSALPPQVARPTYDRSALRAGILHVGLGNFHRAHQAIYYDDLLVAGGDCAWGILGAGVMPADKLMSDDLREQDWLYSVTEMDTDVLSSRVVGAMTGFVDVEGGTNALLSALAHRDLRIVSLTITEGGYFLDAETGGFNPEDPLILADIKDAARPVTIFGTLLAGLRARRDAGLPAFTILSCDNIPHNGDRTRDVIMAVACGQDAELAKWIADNVTFPNGVVDRITPGTSDERRVEIRQQIGVDDHRPVFCEPFRQWVLEDNFANGRPALEEAGVQFVGDVTPFEHMKIRMLNGGHALIAYPAALLGLDHAHDAMNDPLISAFFDKVEREEIYPVVPQVPGTTHAAYHGALRRRFANPRIEDPIRRLCFDGTNRQPKFIVPSIADNLEAGRTATGLALASALWCRYCFGTDNNGDAIAPNDPGWERLRARARAARDNPVLWLEMCDIYGDLSNCTVFVNAFTTALTALHDTGTESTLAAYLSNGAG